MRSNEDKLELFADLLEPAAAIIADKAWAQEWQAGKRVEAIKVAIRGHKNEIIEIMARIEGKDPAEYQIDGLGLFVKLAMMFNRPDIEVVDGLFTPQGQNGDGASSGSATGSIKDGAK